MALVITNDGEKAFLDKILRQDQSGVLPAQDFILRLYTAVSTTLETATVASFTEANFTNYTEKTLNRSNFPAATTNGSNKAESLFNLEETWTCGTTGNVLLGYYIVMTNPSPIVVWAEAFDFSINFTNGDTLKIRPRLELSKA